MQAFSRPGPSWGLSDEYLIQPRIYPYHDSTQFEVTGSCSVRALNATPFLSDSWRQSRNPWQASSGVVPELMLGPDPTDLMKDNMADRDKPSAPVTACSPEQVAAVLPASITDRKDPVGAVRDAEGQKIEVPRNVAQETINHQRQQQRLTRVENYNGRLSEYNKGLVQPGRCAVKL